MQSRIEDFRAAGVRVLAVSTDSMDENGKLAEELGLEFRILSDADREAISAFGIRHEGKGPDGGAIARPATFIVGPGAEIEWRDVTSNWRVRPGPDDILEALGP